MVKVNVRTDWKGLEAFKAKVNVADQQALSSVASNLASRIKSVFPWSGGGREYWWQGVMIRSSAGGEPPIIRSGRLRASITVGMSWKMGRPSSGPDGVIPHYPSDAIGSPSKPVSGNAVAVGSNCPYADDLEWGVPPKLARRPWLTPSYRDNFAAMFPEYVSVMKRFLA